MFFIVSKVLAFVSNPLAWVMLCLIMSVFIKSNLYKRYFTFATIALYLFFGNIYFVKLARKFWDVPTKPILTLPTYDMGIVLGGGSRTMLADTNRVALNWAGDRLVQAVQLYKLGKIKKILFTGGDGRLTKNKHPEANVVYKFFKIMGVPDSAVILENKSRNTRENALFTAEIMKNMSIENTNNLLITNASHMKRSLGCFEKVGIKCTPFSVDDCNEYETYSFIYYFIPDQEMFGSWSFILHEWIGYITYKAKGYI